MAEGSCRSRIVMSTRCAGLTWLRHEAWPSSFLAQTPVSGAVKFHFGEEPVTPALQLLSQEPRARSCSYNQRRPFCVHLRGAWLSPGVNPRGGLQLPRADYPARVSAPALPPRSGPAWEASGPADPGGGKRPRGRKPLLRKRANLRSCTFAPAARPDPWDARFPPTRSGNAS